MVLLPMDLTQNEAANAGIHGDVVANATIYRVFVQVERVTMLESTCISW